MAVWMRRQPPRLHVVEAQHHVPWLLEMPRLPAILAIETLAMVMMDPGEDRILADAIFKVLSNPGSNPNPVLPGGAPASVAGDWAVVIHYSCGTGEQIFALKQNGNALTGEHKGEIYTSMLQG